MTVVSRLTTYIGISLTATMLAAQTPQPPSSSETTQTVQTRTEAVAAETDSDATDPRALRLSLDEAVKTAMERNLGIELQTYEHRMAGEQLVGQHGIFDFFTEGSLAQSVSNQTAVSELDRSSSRTLAFDVALQQTVPTGGSYRFGFDSSRSTVDAFRVGFSPAYRAGLDFNATQPLLRNFGVDITTRGIRIARNTLGINRELFRGVLINTASSVEQAYLDLVYARRNVDVVKESLFLARDQARITQIRIDVGASAPLDILQPRVQIATTEEQLILSVAQVRNAEDRLRALLNLDPADWNRPILPTDPVEYKPITVSAEDSVRRAYELRPEVRQQELARETTRIQYLFARNQVLPRVDAFVNYGGSGIAGRALDPDTGLPDPEIRSTGYSRALTQILQDEFPSWSVGVNFGLPLLNIGARAEARRAELDYRQARTQEDQTRQTIAVDVRQAVRDIDTTARAIAATRTARDAAERNLEAERRRYENGMTTNFQVLQIQQQLSDSRVREIQALVAYNQAVARYHAAVGDLLDVRNIRLEEPEVTEEPKIFPISFDRYNWLNYGSRVKLEEEKKDDDARP